MLPVHMVGNGRRRFVRYCSPSTIPVEQHLSGQLLEPSGKSFARLERQLQAYLQTISQSA